MRIPIHVTSDFICPWCHIGEKRLQKAIQGLPAITGAQSPEIIRKAILDAGKAT